MKAIKNNIGIYFIILNSIFLYMAQAQTIKQDMLFGINGEATTFFSDTFNSITKDIIIQSDGKIIIVGWWWYSNNNVGIALARYDANGLADNAFGTNGKVTSSLGSDNLYPETIGIQSDGKIIVGGRIGQAKTSDFFLARFSQNGSVDQQFGINGLAVISIDTITEEATCMKIQTDDRILLGGHAIISQNGFRSNCILVRYDKNGTLDSTFGEQGISIIDVDTTYGGFARTMELQTDGKIILAGVSGIFGHTVVRCNTNGSLDDNFGVGGITVLYYPEAISSFYDVKMQSSGKIILVGSLSNVQYIDGYILTRLEETGSLDINFGTSGYSAGYINDSTSMSSYSILIRDNDEILLAGGGVKAGVQQKTGGFFAYFSMDGILDSGFGNEGKLYLENDSLGFLNGTLLQSNSQILCFGGYSKTPTPFLLYRMLLIENETNVPKTSADANTLVFASPNPVINDNDLLIKLNRQTSGTENIKVSIVDVQGRIVDAYNIDSIDNQEIKVNTSDLQNGMYLILLNMDNKSYMNKVIVQR